MYKHRPTAAPNGAIESTTPAGLWRYAREYLEAAELIRPKDYTHKLSAPTCYLLGHSIELLLKAFLLAKGRSLDDLVDIGHDLQRALEEADSANLVAFAPSENDYRGLQELVDIIQDEYKFHGFRYFKRGLKRRPDLRTGIPAVSSILDGVSESCGWPAARRGPR